MNNGMTHNKRAGKYEIIATLPVKISIAEELMKNRLLETLKRDETIDVTDLNQFGKIIADFSKPAAWVGRPGVEIEIYGGVKKQEENTLPSPSIITELDIMKREAFNIPPSRWEEAFKTPLLDLDRPLAERHQRHSLRTAQTKALKKLRALLASGEYQISEEAAQEELKIQEEWRNKIGETVQAMSDAMREVSLK